MLQTKAHDNHYSYSLLLFTYNSLQVWWRNIVFLDITFFERKGSRGNFCQLTLWTIEFMKASPSSATSLYCNVTFPPHCTILYNTCIAVHILLITPEWFHDLLKSIDNRLGNLSQNNGHRFLWTITSNKNLKTQK